MRKVLAALAAIVIIICAIGWNAEADESRRSEQKFKELRTDYGLLELSYQSAKNEAMQNENALKAQAAELGQTKAQITDLNNKVADLQRQVSAARSSRSSRGGARTTHANLIPSIGMSTDFWWNLSKGCECKTGDCAHSGGFFQFKGSTATKVGYKPGQSWDVQKQEAIWWAGELEKRHVSPGSTSGWPHCWWEAKRLTAAAA